MGSISPLAGEIEPLPQRLNSSVAFSSQARMSGSWINGISASRAYLPNVYLDETRCSRLIDCLDSYRKEWDDKLGTWKDKPVHDQFSHGYKSFETAAVRKPAVDKPKVVAAPIPSSVNGFRRRA